MLCCYELNDTHRVNWQICFPRCKEQCWFAYVAHDEKLRRVYLDETGRSFSLAHFMNVHGYPFDGELPHQWQHIETFTYNTSIPQAVAASIHMMKVRIHQQEINEEKNQQYEEKS